MQYQLSGLVYMYLSGWYKHTGLMSVLKGTGSASIKRAISLIEP
jgi:hypothetical protein